MASLPSSSVLLPVLILILVAAATDAATFTVINKCQYTVWAAAVPAGGGRQLDAGQTWSINVPAGTTGGRVWARTGCSFDGAGNGRCQTGDCGGKLQCTQYGQAPNTLAEFGLNKYMNLDFFDISLIDGYNVPMSFLPAPGSPGCPKGGPQCPRVITPHCPNELRAAGGCNNACTVFKEDRYCCTGSAANNCGPTDYSRFFKGQCSDAYSYPKDDATSTYTCPGGTNYQVIFCP
ncbi:alpha-amylase/trypsin inhibitor [Aegilops tauschii subsp. strangulata]|uniref:Thaumatin-like protein n=2 Tax=Aegilops tauschii TaxID=37682 RepID=A0A453H1B4_AEGTS|nr:alpha-amylase/trypsin inhibitor [Aegilops tauschii subsp. strangulata]